MCQLREILKKRNKTEFQPFYKQADSKTPFSDTFLTKNRLTIIIMSATINVEAFQHYFDGAPIIDDDIKMDRPFIVYIYIYVFVLFVWLWFMIMC
jgi:hypothetical protein